MRKVAEKKNLVRAKIGKVCLMQLFQKHVPTMNTTIES